MNGYSITKARGLTITKYGRAATGYSVTITGAATGRAYTATSQTEIGRERFIARITDREGHAI